MSSVFVTGGAGFIGSNYLRLLLDKTDYDIICFDKLTYAGNWKNLPNDKRVKFWHSDILDTRAVHKALTKYQPEYIVHFAAESHVDRSIDSGMEFIKTNIEGTYKLLNTAKECLKDFKFVHVSTDEVYGSIDAPDKFTEESPYEPNSPYASSKASSDLLCKSFFTTFDFPVVITNCSNNYGGYQHPEKLIPTVIQKCIQGEPIPIYGDGLNVRDWIHVEDHCKAVLAVMEDGVLGETYNIGADCTKTNLEIVDTITKIFKERTGDDSTVEFVEDRLGHDHRYAIDSTKIINTLKWSPEIEFEAGIKLTVDWYLTHQDWVNDTITRSGYRSGRLGLQDKLNGRGREAT